MKEKLKTKYLILVGLVCLLLCGCTVGADKNISDDNEYGTSNRTTALEYGIYINKQITVYCNQITTRLTMIKSINSLTNTETKSVIVDEEIALVKQSIDILNDTYNEVSSTYPSVPGEDDRDSIMSAMELTIDHITDYHDALVSGQSLDEYSDLLQADFNQLTGLANLYNE